VRQPPAGSTPYTLAASALSHVSMPGRDADIVVKTEGNAGDNTRAPAAMTSRTLFDVGLAEGQHRQDAVRDGHEEGEGGGEGVHAVELGRLPHGVHDLTAQRDDAVDAMRTAGRTGCKCSLHRHAARRAPDTAAMTMQDSGHRNNAKQREKRGWRRTTTCRALRRRIGRRSDPGRSSASSTAASR